MADVDLTDCEHPLEVTGLWRITVASPAVRLRGEFRGTLDDLQEFSRNLIPVGTVIASPMGAAGEPADPVH